MSALSLETQHKLQLLALFAQAKPGVVPKDALDYFKAKKLAPAFSHKEVWKEEHNYAFTAAKILEADVLSYVQGSLEGALEEGRTFREWADIVKPLLDQSGWASYGTEAEAPSRLRTIFDTNMRVARAVGQWQRVERAKRTHPYLQYLLGPSKEHRQTHVQWAGLVLRIDDPFWDTCYPPNGYGCKCRVRQLSKREAEEIGIDTAPEISDSDLEEGWDYNPGKERAAAMRDALDESESEVETLRAKREFVSLALAGGWRVSKNGKKYWYSYEPKGGREKKQETAPEPKEATKLPEPSKETDAERKKREFYAALDAARTPNEKWYADMPEPQKKALASWRASGYRAMRALESGKGLKDPAVKGELVGQEEKMKQHLADFREALKSAPEVKGTVYRGLHSLSDTQFESLTSPGATLKQEALSSWTEELGVAHTFAKKGYNDDRAVVLELRTSSGAVRAIHQGGNALGDYEKEAIAPKGLAMTVVAVAHEKTPDGIRYARVVVEEVADGS